MDKTNEINDVLKELMTKIEDMGLKEGDYLLLCDKLKKIHKINNDDDDDDDIEYDSDEDSDYEPNFICDDCEKMIDECPWRVANDESEVIMRLCIDCMRKKIKNKEIYNDMEETYLKKTYEIDCDGCKKDFLNVDVGVIYSFENPLTLCNNCLKEKIEKKEIEKDENQSGNHDLGYYYYIE